MDTQLGSVIGTKATIVFNASRQLRASSFGEFLRDLRESILVLSEDGKKKALSRSALAERAQVATTTLENIELGKIRRPTHGVAMQLAEALELKEEARKELWDRYWLLYENKVARTAPDDARELLERMRSSGSLQLGGRFCELLTAGVLNADAQIRPYQKTLGRSPQDIGGFAKNGPTTADIAAGVAFVSSVAGGLRRLAELMGAVPLIALEESGSPESARALDEALSPEDRALIRSFLTPTAHQLAALVDPCDATKILDNGLEYGYAVTAVGFVGEQPRVSVVYLPSVDELYQVALNGEFDEAGENAAARLTFRGHHATEIDLIDLVRDAEERPLNRSSIAVHLTRSDDAKLDRFLSDRRKGQPSPFRQLLRAAGSTFQLNAGALAMMRVLTGSFSAFINHSCLSHDLMPIIPFAQACAPCIKVTDFRGNPIDFFTGAERQEVVVARQHVHAELIDILAVR